MITSRTPGLPDYYKTQKPRYIVTRLCIKFGTDLLSHILLQYHRLWRA